jgi:hypothetical protein
MIDTVLSTLHPWALLGGIVFGYFYLYFSRNRKKRTVYVFPNPDNVEKVVYRDATGACFRFLPRDRPCEGTAWQNLFRLQPQIT